MSESPTLRVLIVDDEPLARERIRRLLQHEGDVTIVGAVESAAAAVDLIGRDRIDVAFLDIQMPGADGFTVLERHGASIPPLIVFVTAHESYAVRAFETAATDYLLKPFSDERFSATLDRIRSTIRARSESDESEARPVSSISPEQIDRIAVKTGDRMRLIRAESIEWIEAAGPYARIRAGSDTHILRVSMSELEARLDAQTFFRIHRSTIVNLEYVRELREYFRGEYLVIMRDGTELKLSRGRRAALTERFGAGK